MRWELDEDGWEVPVCDQCGQWAEMEDLYGPDGATVWGPGRVFRNAEVTCMCKFCRTGTPYLMVWDS